MPGQEGKVKGQLSQQDQEGMQFRTNDHWLSEIIDEARRNGDFDNLPGHGKPLHLADDDPFGGDEAKAMQIMKNANVVPEWIELRPKIVDELNWLRANPNHPERPSRIVEANILIDKHNRLVPKPSLVLPKVTKEFGRHA